MSKFSEISGCSIYPYMVEGCDRSDCCHSGIEVAWYLPCDLS
ncbi:hypothetical protein [Argonema galeatum]|nr:hypothetical protein [Argonema galeatum]